jgi:hypothetical protein
VLEALNNLQGTESLVDIRRDPIAGSTRGFVAAVTAEFVVLSLVGDECHFDGTGIIRTEDVTLVRWDDDVLRSWTRILAESPSAPESVRHIDLTSWESIVRSVAAREHMVTFHRELVDGGVYHIGTKIAVLSECFTAEEVTVEGTIDGKFALPLEDLTRIDFGSGYERALWRMIRASQG